MATTFRPATPRDLEPVRGPLAALCGPAASGGLARFLEEPNLGLSWLIERAGEAVGYLVLSFADPDDRGTRRAYVSGLYLRPDQRGAGLGTLALRFAHEVGRALGFQVLSTGIAREDKAPSRSLASARTT